MKRLYEEESDMAGIPTRKERSLYLNVCAMELGVPPEELLEHITSNSIATAQPRIYVKYLARALQKSYTNIGTIKDRKIRPEREMNRIAQNAMEKTLTELSQAA